MSGTLITVDSSRIDTPRGTAELNVSFDNPIYNRNLDYEIALVKANLFFSVFNITDDHNNRDFHWSSDSGSTWNLDQIPAGIYSVEDLNNVIESITSNAIKVEANYATGKQYVTLAASHQVRWSTTPGLAKLFGFDITATPTQTVSQYGSLIGDFTVDVTAWQIHNSLINGFSYDNGQSSDVIFNFSPQAPPFAAMDVEPKNLIYVHVSETVIKKMNIRITDQKNKLLDFNGEHVVLLFHLRQKQK